MSKADKPLKPGIRRLDEMTQEPVLDHEYDGIEELDNPLPGWWLATFYLTIVFAAGYFSWHNILSGGHVHEESYQQEWQALQARYDAEAKAKEKALDPVAFAKELANPALVAPGKGVFDGKCAACHGAQAEGLIGPNLTDEYWLHGNGSALETYKVVDQGVNEKGMPAWGPVLQKDELKQVVAYVISLKGSKPANAKAPQGSKF